MAIMTVLLFVLSFLVLANAAFIPPEYVQCQTTKGPFRIRVYPEWAPKGVERFLAMVDSGFFTNLPFFRVVPGFVAQFGASPNLNATQAWKAEGKITDDTPLGIAWKKGMISFAGSGPNTRGTQMFIGYKNSESLGKQPWETPLGFVDRGFSTIHQLNSEYGELTAFGGNAPDSRRIMEEGGDFLKTEFPRLDYFTSCERVIAPPPTARPTPRKPPPAPTPMPTVPPTYPEPICDAMSCGAAFAADQEGTIILCSCHAECIVNDNCCEGFTSQCPVQMKQGQEMAEVARMKCTAETCGGELALDPAGEHIVCSCHFKCLEDENCCSGFQDQCPGQLEVLAKQRGKAKQACVSALKPRKINRKCKEKKWSGFIVAKGKCARRQLCMKQPKGLRRFKLKNKCEAFLDKCASL